MASTRAGRREPEVKPRSDAYTGILVLSLLALIGASVLMYFDWQSFKGKPQMPNVQITPGPAGAGAGGFQGGAGAGGLQGGAGAAGAQGGGLQGGAGAQGFGGAMGAQGGAAGAAGAGGFMGGQP